MPICWGYIYSQLFFIEMDAHVDWDKPYTVHILSSVLERRELESRIRVLPFSEKISSCMQRPEGAIVEAPEGKWMAWWFADGNHAKCALAWEPSTSEEGMDDLRAAQKQRAKLLHKTQCESIQEIKVPPVASHQTDSGVAALFNVLWLLRGSKKGHHPGAKGYMDLRKEEYEEFMKVNTI